MCLGFRNVICCCRVFQFQRQEIEPLRKCNICKSGKEVQILRFLEDENYR